MLFHRGAKLRILPLLAVALVTVSTAVSMSAQSGNAGAVHGTVTDPSGAVIPGATVHLTNQRFRIRSHDNQRRHRPVQLRQRAVQSVQD